ncbi:MAG: hypothetical protein D6791_06490 [Chloroflexi bacterium]|nr:MAG: hypothetical protein D6791_06490 [Chloroflexota bacterium]
MFQMLSGQRSSSRGQGLEAEISGLGNVHRHTVAQTQVSQFVIDNRLGELHAGEVECLCLCRQMAIPILLTDDLAVRETAKRLGLIPVGSLGIVVRAYQVGEIHLEDAERHLMDLYDISSLFVTRAIVELAVEQLHSSDE